jgi:phytoene/squalene synthetase
MTHSDGAAHALAVGRATRLTQVLHDLGRDVAAGRILLPLEDLARFKYSEREMLRRVVNDDFREVVRFEVARARQLFRDGAAGACWLAGDGSRVAAATFVSLQLARVDAIENNIDYLFRTDADDFTRPSVAAYFRRARDAWRLAKRQADDPLPKLV